MSTEATKSDLVDACGYQIAFTRAGRGPAVALIHGIPTNDYLWRGVVPPLVGRVLRSPLSTFSATAHPTSPLMPASGSRPSLA